MRRVGIGQQLFTVRYSLQVKPVQVQLSALFHSNITSNAISFASSSSVVRTLVKATFQSYSTAIENANGPLFVYGNCKFQDIRNRNLFYVDNTRFICDLHKMMYEVVIMHRPPRFGKSLFLSTLATYYDKAISKTQREKLFKGLYISKNPVPGAGKYYVFHLDLSVNIDGNENTIIANLHKTIDESIVTFTSKYQIPISDKLQVGSVLRDSNSLLSFRSLCSWMTLRSLPLFVILDEYDRFANKLLFENPKMYKTTVSGESGVGGSSFLRSLFETFKWASSQFITKENTQYPAFRLFAVGLCPLALADASGANIFEDISLNPTFADMFGFKQDDLKVGFELLTQSGKVKPEQVPRLLELMKSYYNGYKFHSDQIERLYNPTLSLFFFKSCTQLVYLDKVIELPLPDTLEIIKDNQIKFPSTDLVSDRNVSISENIFNVLANNPLTSGLITRLQQGPVNIPVILQYQNILSNFTMGELFESSSKMELTLLSLMYYHGVVTYGDCSNGRIDLQVPNFLARTQFIGRIDARVSDHLSRFVLTLDPRDLKAALQSQLSMLGPMDGSFNELTLKVFCLSMFKHLGSLGLQVTITNEFQFDKNSDFTKRIDCVFTTKDLRSIIIEVKTLMPHNLVLDNMKVELSDSTRSPYGGNKGTHFWRVGDKKSVYHHLENLPYTEILELKHTVRDDKIRDIKKEVLDRFKNERESLTKNTVKYYFHEGKEQLVDYGIRYLEKQKIDGTVFTQPPELFLISTLWNLHVNVAKIEFDAKQK